MNCMGPYNRKLGQGFLLPVEAAVSTVQEMLEACHCILLPLEGVETFSRPQNRKP